MIYYQSYLMQYLKDNLKKYQRCINNKNQKKVEMGNAQGTAASNIKSSIKIASFSYASFRISPFQIFTHELLKHKRGLNKQFKRLKSEFTEEERDYIEKNKMILRKKDEQTCKFRYSPLYQKFCGVEDGLFISQERFKEKWNETMHKNEYYMFDKDKQSMNNKEQQDKEAIQYLKKFDILCYKTFVSYTEQIQDLSKIIEERSVIKYLDFMNDFFSKKNQKQNVKIQKVIKLIKKNSVDVIVILDGSKELRQKLEKQLPNNYKIVIDKKKVQDKNKNQGLILVVNEGIFKYAKDGQRGILRFQQIINNKHLKDKQLFRCGETLCLSIDRFIFLAVNMDRSADGNKKNEQKQETPYEQLMKTIKELRITFPKKYIIVVGQVKKKMQEQNDANQIDIKQRDIHLSINIKFTNQRKQQQDCFKIEPSTENEKYTKNIQYTSFQLEYPLQEKKIIQLSNRIIYDSRLRATPAKIYQIKQKDDLAVKNFSAIEEYIPNIPNIPNQNHPFESYIVMIEVQTPEMKEKKDEKLIGFSDLVNQILKQPTEDGYQMKPVQSVVQMGMNMQNISKKPAEIAPKMNPKMEKSRDQEIRREKWQQKIKKWVWVI